MLNGKTALITGGSRGIGKAIAVAMAKAGANVAIIYSGNREKAQETTEELIEIGVRSHSYLCDVSDYKIVEETVKKVAADFGKIDILVNNAGITRDNLMMVMKPEEFDEVINTNLNGAFYVTRLVAAGMMRNKSGAIINITSVSGMMGNPGQANYAAAKAGLIGLTKTTAKELASRNIRCNGIAPGFINTEMTAKLQENVKAKAVETIPMKRMGSPEDIANTAVFLASDLAGYITGEIIKIDGGLYV